MKTRSTRLGQFLLKGFHAKSDRKAGPKKRKRRVRSSYRILKVSEMQGSSQKRKTDAPQIQEDLTPNLTEVSTSSTPTLPAPIEPTPVIPQVILSEPPPFEGAYAISTIDLVRPEGKLKESIEGFLLDQRSEHTRRAYGKDLKRFVQFLLERDFKLGPAQITRTLLIAYKESLLTQGLEHTTVDRHLATLRSFFQWLVDDGILIKSPAEGVRFLNPKRISKTNGFSDEEVKKLLAIPDLHSRTGSLHYAILMILFYCGLRRSELCQLRTVNVGTERGQTVLRLRGKGNSERMIVMITPVWNALKHYLLITRRDLSRDDYLFHPVRNNRTGTLNKPLDPSMIFYIVTRYAKLAGIANRVSPHSCRATAISNARDHHVPDRAIQEFAGWSSPDMITRYDKRKTSVEDSASHAIFYGAENRLIPQSPELAIKKLTPSETAPKRDTSLASSQSSSKGGPEALPPEGGVEFAQEIPTQEMEESPV